MAYDAVLAERVRKILEPRTDIMEQRMFRGVVFLLDGNLCCGVRDRLLLLHLGTRDAAVALTEPYASQIDLRGEPSRSMVSVTAAGYRTDEGLLAWVTRAINFATTLPAKTIAGGA